MKISLWSSLRNIVALGVIGLGANVQAAETYRLPSPDIDYQLDQGTLLIRGQSESYFASYDNAGTFGHTTGGGPAAAGNGSCNTGLDCECIGNWWDNTAIFFAGDAWKGVGESAALGFGNSFGIRQGFNTGFAIGDSNIRGQVGGSFGLYDFKGRTQGPEQAEIETQLFFTTGVYKRSDIEYGDAWSWGAVYDVMNDNNYGIFGDELTISQGRALIGYATSEANEFGVWGTFQVSQTSVQLVGPDRTPVRPVNQANAFWHHNYAFGGDTYAYVGLADGLSDFTWGVTGNAPLSNSLAVFGGFNYYAPSAAIGPAGAAEEFWNVSFGIVWYPGCKAANSTVSGWKGMPLLNVADNGTFQVTP